MRTERLAFLFEALFALLLVAPRQQVHGKALSLGPSSTTSISSSFVANSNSDSCDWEGSGLTEHGSERVVVPIYLRCLQGSVKWLYPKSALQVTLRHGPSEADFRGCIRVASNTSSRVRIYVEGVYQSLHKIYSHDDKQHPDLVRCFVSHGGQVSLYLEADQFEPLIRREVFQFSYHLEPVTSKHALLDDLDECRPCSDYEMHTFFCASDFIIRGAITSLHNNEALARTELTLNASQIQKPLFPIVNSPSIINTANHQQDRRNGLAQRPAPSPTAAIVLHRPLKCLSRAGLGSEFLFMGKWVLGNPVIKCAPKVSYWKRVKSNAIATGSNQCQLS